MTLTRGQIEDALYQLVKNSPIPATVNGGLYKRGYRPAKSNKEDIVVSIKMSTAQQIQRGTALITVFVPWITIADGTDGRNIARCNTIEIALQAFLSSLSETASERDIRWTQAYAIGTDEDEDINHSRVVAELEFNIFTEE